MFLHPIETRHDLRLEAWTLHEREACTEKNISIGVCISLKGFWSAHPCSPPITGEAADIQLPPNRKSERQGCAKFRCK